jgi:hypothetical protein
MSGYFLVYRGLHDKPLFKSNQPFSRFEAWLDTIELANFTESSFRHNSTMFPIPRGAVGTSYRALAKRWKWSVDRVIRELKLWSGQGMVDLDTRQGYLHVTICNYEQYQNPHDADATETRHAHDTDATRTSTNQKKEKKEKKEKNKEPPTPYPDWLPLDAWNAYLEVRQKLRAPNTSNALTLLLTKLTALRDAGHDPRRVIEQSIERGWRSFFQPKGDTHENPRRQFTPGPTKDQRARGAVMRAAERLGFAPQSEPREPAETRDAPVP